MTSTVQRPGRRLGAPERLARVSTEVFSPAYLVVGLQLLVGAATADSIPAGLAWGGLSALFAGVLPYAFLLHGVRRGRYGDRHVKVREQRMIPLLFAGGCVVTGLALLALLGAPRELTALAVAMLTGLVVTLAVTTVWKISVHTAVAAGTAVILTLVFGAALAVVWPIVAVTAWSRVVLRDHTVAQVLAGAVMGALVAGLVFSALR